MNLAEIPDVVGAGQYQMIGKHVAVTDLELRRVDAGILQVVRIVLLQNRNYVDNLV